ncbi:PcfB family protein [uncultured Subdoligranulum sp.]|uniref:PcfB family protein n=1 Tax=uncultured Subdoligranulum sp. TaxID=512298 RepID=UPI00262EBA73|nr:PcfB family protein [uncultured Subdoligranulum sp.]
MNLGSDPADQVVRYTLEGTEFALRISGTAAKNFAIFAAAVLRDQKKTRGKTNLTRLLREGKPLKFFSVSADRMREFAQEAKRHGLLFVPMRDRNDPNHIEVAIWADDAAKVERIIERMQLDVVETGEAEIMSDVTPEQPTEHPAQGQAWPDRQPAQAADGPIPFEPDDTDYDLGFTQPAPSPAEPGSPPPSRSTRRTDLPSAPPSTSRNSSLGISPAPRADRVRARGERPSVRDELREIKAMLRQRESVTPRPKAPIRIHRGGQAR